jgi:hypothetical protein
MRCAGLGILALTVAAGGCAGRHPAPVTVTPTPLQVSGIWDGLSRTTIDDGIGAGDTRIEKQEWHLTQAGDAISGYYIAALTFVSGDGRPYVCSRQPRFQAVQRFDVSGRVRAGVVEIEEVTQRAGQGRCDPGVRRLARYRGRLQGDVLTLVSDGQRQTLYRNRNPGEPVAEDLELANASGGAAAAESPFPSLSSDRPGPTIPSNQAPADVSGLWVWEHRGIVPGGDEKQEREEWHVTQEGAKLSGYYDRVVRQVSVDGHAYRCSMALDFQIATRYQITGEVRGTQVIIYESSFEILEPNACDNGKRRLDAYEGQAAPDELRLVWGVGGQVLRRPRPDVPTQRF